MIKIVKNILLESSYDDYDDFILDDEDYSSNYASHQPQHKSIKKDFKTLDEKTEYYKQLFKYTNELNEDLDLRGCSISNLGALKTVYGNVDLSETLIQDLGKLDYVSGNFFLNNCEFLTSLSKFSSVAGNFFLLNNTSLHKITYLSYVGGNLSIRNCPITQLEDYLHVGGKIQLSPQMAKEIKISENLKSKLIISKH